jgi:methylated-DNA-[protein]-cysteine S-methyltransferase
MLADELRGLAVERAPRGLLRKVLEAIDPADRAFSIDTELGKVFVAYNEAGLSAVTRCDGEAEFEAYVRRYRNRGVRFEPPPERLREQLRRALAGRPVDLRFDLRGLTPFERDVLLKAVEIPRGEVRTYGWIAREIGRPLAVRAVGTALANNPIPLFIPCHRVVRSDGTIGQYGMGGPAVKRSLLLHEGVPAQRLGRTLAV